MTAKTDDTRTLRSITWPEFVAGGGAAKDAEPFDVVIVGSGYGGSVAAYTLSLATVNEGGQAPRVLLLERGRAFHPGDFPSTFAELPRELRVARQDSGEVSGHEGLFDLRLGEDVAVMVANGLGGGSLINAGVMLDPDPDDVRAGPLSAHLRRLIGRGVFKRARRMLGGEVFRSGHWVRNHVGRLAAPLHKNEAYRRIAIARAAEADPVDITVALDDGLNFAGNPLNACIQCGDCMTGCNYGAKDSLDRNLLLAAQERLGHRLVIVTGATVTSVVPGDHPPEPWQLRVVHTDARLQEREPRAARVAGRRVVLAAGTLGSPEILLRSRSDQFVLSDALGESFSGNGDDIAAIHRLKEPVFSSADEDVAADQRRVGPTTTARVKLQQRYGRPFLLEEFSVPGPMKRLFDETVTTGYTINQLPKGDCTRHGHEDHDPLAVDEEAMQRTLLVGVIGHDDAGGSLRLAKPLRPVGGTPQMGALRIHWPQARWGREFDATHESLRRFAEHPIQPPFGQGPTLVANPMWRLLPAELDNLVSQPRGPVLTVHPLGGCRIGTDAKEGVVDRWGRVFMTGSPGVEDRFGTLVVLDGSIIGGSLGVNPALTITSLALHAMRALCRTWGLRLPGADPHTDPKLPTKAAECAKADPLPALKPPAPLPERSALRVTERLWGRVALQGHDDCVAELTMGFAPMSVAQLIGKKRVAMQVEPARSRLRLFKANVWDEQQLEGADDGEREAFVCFECELSGSLLFLHREQTRALPRTLRALWHWSINRGVRDTWQRLEAHLTPARHKHRQALKAARPLPPGAPPKPNIFLRIWRELCNFANLASHNGQVRLFDYGLKVGKVLRDGDGFGKQLKQDAVIKGEKRLGYGRRASPWTQLTEMQLLEMPGLQGTPAPFKLDGRFLARRGTPLIEVAQQRNHAEALAELLSFGLYMLRVLIDTHLWSFRKPDREGPPLPEAQSRREPDRLPGDLPEVPPPKIETLVVDRWPKDSPYDGEPVSIQLTRYAQPPQKAPGKPLVMIHGYSASGTTFAHPSLQPSAAQHFWKQGRDVWVLDLRTSCGLPSATWPWAMEQPGLIDIPAALLHVHNSTGQKVDVLAHCIGGAMLGMALLSDAAAVRSGLLQLGVDSWLTSEQLGVLTAFNGAEPAGGAHPVIDRIVLSQKGPVMRYTDNNVLRAFVLQYVRRWLLPNGWRFRASANPGVTEELVDRLLSSLPYPKADFDVENPLRPCAKTPWTTTRHRLDALFGRTFTAANLRPETLLAIDDFFGPINLDTVAQTIHFARFDAITNQRGRGEFVTRDRLRARWGGIATLALHGQDNGLTSPYTLRLLAKSLGDVGATLTTQLLDNTGHQDTLIGRGAARVFDHIEAFFAGHVPANQSSTPADPWIVSWPWIGPRLVAPSTTDELPAVAVMTAPHHGDATLWLVPVTQHSAPAAGAPRFSLLPGAPAGWVRGDRGDSLFWLFATPNASALQWPTSAAGKTPGWLALVIYEVGQSVAVPLRKAPAAGGGAVSAAAAGQRSALRPPSHGAVDSGFPLSSKKKPSINLPTGLLQPNATLAAAIAASITPTVPLAATSPGPLVDPELVAAVERWLAFEPLAREDTGFIAAADVLRTALLADEQKPLRFALASCQYPNGLFDRDLADQSLDMLASQPDDTAPPISLALMVGDQIYADASAGLVDPTRRDELYDLPHQRAFRLDGMRRVMRRMPVEMLLDDHELFDNWEPLPLTLNGELKRVKDEVERRDDARRDGVGAYRRYQRMLRPDEQGVNAPQDFSFMAGGHAFYMLDTRSCRQRGAPSGGPGGGYIVSGAQQLGLESWLLKHKLQVKFIATPSLLLPRREEVIGRPANACRVDSWAGFPDSLHWLLRFIMNNDLRKVVFVSGDEHHSLHATTWLGSGYKRIKLVSVHSSGLYAPYPFANGRPRDLRPDDSKPIAALPAHTRTYFAKGGNGFVALQVIGTPSTPALKIDYCKPGLATVSEEVSLM